MKFVDHVRIHAKAGDGGNGCCSFRREKFVPRGGPDGGDGGDGGSVILKADPHTDNLASLYYEPNVRAGRGSHGQGKDKHGRNGRSVVVKVPIGTVVYGLPEEFSARPDIAELCINHVKGGVLAVYDRYRYAPEIKAALALWASQTH